VRLSLAGALVGAVATVGLTPAAIAQTPPDPGSIGLPLPTPSSTTAGTGSALPPPPGVPVANPLYAPVGNQPHVPASPCQFSPLHASTAPTTVFSAPDETQLNQELLGSASQYARFSVDPWNPCHLFRSFPGFMERSDDAGRHWSKVFVDPAASDPVSLGGPAATAGKFDNAYFDPLINVGPGQAYMVDMGGSDGAFFTADEGATWSERDGGLVTAPWESAFPLRRQALSGVEPIEGDSGVRAVAFAASAPKTGYLVASVAGETILYRTGDGGSSWAPLVVPQSELDAVAVDPGDPDHVYIAGGGGWTLTATGAVVYQQTAGEQGVPLKGLWESGDGGATWSHLAGPAGASPVQLVATRYSDHAGRPSTVHLYAQVMVAGATAGSLSEEPYSSADGGRTWTHFPLPRDWVSPAGAPITFQNPSWSIVAADPVHPQQMLWAIINANQIDLALSTDGFATDSHAHVSEPGQVLSVDLTADRFDDFFLGTVHSESQASGAVATIDTLRMIHIEPGSPPAWGVRGYGESPSLATCNLSLIDPLDYNAKAREQQTAKLTSAQANSVYWNGSLAFDGQYLDYSQDDLAPGVIYRLDPVTCQAAGTIHLDKLSTYIGQWNRPALEAVTYDPDYRFPNGHLGALLARGHRDDDGSVADPAGHGPVYAVDLQAADGTYQLVGSVPCSQARTDDLCDFPTTFTYDRSRHALWVWDQGTPANRYSFGAVALEAMPVDPKAPPKFLPSCMTAKDWSSTGEPFDSFAGGADSWLANGRGFLYAQNQDTQTVSTVDTATCTVLSSFQHRSYQGSAEFIEQLACDPLSFGDRLGLPGARSVLWLRDVNSNSVSAYAVPDSFCPQPTGLRLVPPAPITVGSSVGVCARLVGDLDRDTPLAGHTLVFGIGSASLSAVTRGDGTACTAALPVDTAGRVQLTVEFQGTASYLPSSDTGSLLVAALLPVSGGIAGNPTAKLDTPPAPVPAPQLRGEGTIRSAPPPPEPVSQPNSPVQANQPVTQAGVAVQEQRRTQVATEPGGRSLEQSPLLQMVAQRASGGPPAWAPAVAGLVALVAGWLLARSPRPQIELARDRSPRRRPGRSRRLPGTARTARARRRWRGE